jgi:hypothetical protein
MAYTNDQIFVNAYNAMLHHLSEQRGSKLKGLFQEEKAKGEKHFFDRVGSFSVSEINAINSPISLQDSTMSRRMATLRAFDAATTIHDIEKMKMLVDPTNDYVVKMMNAHGKNYDLSIINALIGTAATGKDGSGSQALGAGQQIAHGGTGLTVDKLLQGLRILESADVDMDSNNVYLLVNALGREDLLADNKFISSDFQEVKSLAGKSFPSFRGIQIVKTERLPDQTAGSVRRAILCTDNALKVAVGMDPVVDISQRKDLNNLPYQIYTQQAFGAVRMEESLVVDILFQ